MFVSDVCPTPLTYFVIGCTNGIVAIAEECIVNNSHVCSTCDSGHVSQGWLCINATVSVSSSLPTLTLVYTGSLGDLSVAERQYFIESVVQILVVRMGISRIDIVRF